MNMTVEQKLKRDSRIGEMTRKYQILRRQRAADEKQQRAEKAEYGSGDTGLKTKKDCRDYFKDLSPDMVPLVENEIEFMAVLSLALDGHKAAQKVCPSVNPLSLSMAIGPDYHDVLRAQTIALEGNVRPNGVKKNMDQQARMEMNGFDKLSNPKGDMLVTFIDNKPVIADGMNSSSGHVKLDVANDTRTPYYVRVHLLRDDELDWVDLLLDGYCAKRAPSLVAQIYRKTGGTMTGWPRTRHLLLASQMCNYDKGMSGNDGGALVDEIVSCHKRYLEEIDHVLQYDSLLSKSKHVDLKTELLKAPALASLAFALRYFKNSPAELAKVKQFIEAYSMLSSSSPNQHVNNLVTWLKAPTGMYRPAVLDAEGNVVEKAWQAGGRERCKRITCAVSFWVYTYVKGMPAMCNGGDSKKPLATRTDAWYFGQDKVDPRLAEILNGTKA